MPPKDDQVSGNGIALVKIGAEMVSKVAPKSIWTFKSWLWRKDVLIVGQKHAGKSTFVDFIQHGLFQDERETEETLDTIQSRQFTMRLNATSTLELSAKATDLPGHIGPKAHAKCAFDKRPHAILVFLDASTIGNDAGGGDAGEWLQTFCDRLNDLWRTKDRKYNRTQSLIVVANKVDKIPKHRGEDWKKPIVQIANCLGEGLGKVPKPVLVRPCILVTNDAGPKLAQQIVEHLIKKLT